MGGRVGAYRRALGPTKFGVTALLPIAVLADMVPGSPTEQSGTQVGGDLARLRAAPLGPASDSCGPGGTSASSPVLRLGRMGRRSGPSGTGLGQDQGRRGSPGPASRGRPGSAMQASAGGEALRVVGWTGGASLDR